MLMLKINILVDSGKGRVKFSDTILRYSELSRPPDNQLRPSARERRTADKAKLGGGGATGHETLCKTFRHLRVREASPVRLILFRLFNSSVPEHGINKNLCISEVAI